MQKFCPLTFVSLVLVSALVVPLAAQTVPLDALMRGGRIHYDGQRFERAREQFQKALDQYGTSTDNGNLAQIHTWLGLCDAQLHAFPAAAEHFLVAMEKDTATGQRIRANEQWQYHAGTALINVTRDNYFAGQNETALRYALGALQVDPTKPQIYSLIANIYSALGRYDDMRRTAEDMLKLDSKSAEGFGLLGLYFLQKPDSLWPTPAARVARWDSSAHYYDQSIIIYAERFARASADLGQTMKLTDTARINELTWQLISRSRAGQAELKYFLEKELKVGASLVEVASAASRLHAAANNLNTASSRAGSAMLSASAQTRADTSERFRTSAETYFTKAVAYDSGDFTALFDLGITYYQGKQDSLAEAALVLVTRTGVVPLTDLPPACQDSLIAALSPEAAANGSLELTGPLAATVDSAVYAATRRNGLFAHFYFPELKGKPFSGTVTPEQRDGMFLSALQPQLLEETYVWLGSSQTGLASSLADAKRKDDAKAMYEKAVLNLLTAVRLNPASADAYQNLGICYRELGEKQKALDAFEKADKIRKGK